MKKIIDMQFILMSILYIGDMILSVIDSNLSSFCGWFCAYFLYICMRLERLYNEELKKLVCELHDENK